MKRVLRVILFSLISLLLLTSMLITAMLGNVKAEYFKSLSTSLDFEAVPDLALEYYIKDGNNSSGKKGMYGETKNIQQTIKTLATPGNTIYQIKIPVCEEGYYQLSFYVDFRYNDSNVTEVFATNMDTPVGCQVVSASKIAFGSGTTLSLSPDSASKGNGTGASTNYGIKLNYSAQPLLAAKDHYQWKTVAPTRGENVNLTFYASNDDVSTKKYVVWAWEFTGLVASTNYTLCLNNICITRITPEDEDAPRFEFMGTQYVNNAIYPTELDKNPNQNAWRGVKRSGYTRYNRARGTYVTNGTYDSLTMQLSPLYYSWTDSSRKDFLTGAIGSNYENVCCFNVPMKNIKPDVDYRVSFDFSVAMQGTAELYTEYHDNTSICPIIAQYANYSGDYDSFFNSYTGGSNMHFQSYLHSGTVNGRLINSHTTARGQISCKNKIYSAHEVTRYDEIMSVAASSSVDPTCAYTTADAISGGKTHAEALNSGITDSARYNSGDDVNSYSGKGEGINWFNAIKHTELQGENQINWLTFYNTTFAFNIKSGASVSNGYCSNLYWTWAIDALEQTRWFRIKIENVRIEEVVQYGSNITKAFIGGTQLDDCYPNDVQTLVPTISTAKALNATFRNANGTGQNYQARGYIYYPRKSTDARMDMAATNIFGAVYDAGDRQITGDAYNIAISGYCAAKGGVDRYVWSADEGKTWHDMICTTDSQLRQPETNGEKNRISTYCEKAVDQARINRYDTTNKTITSHGEGSSRNVIVNDEEYTDYYSNTATTGSGDFIDFKKGIDDINSVFVKLVADLSEYRYQQNLNIIFAAVPRENMAARCEIFRIINFNSDKMHRTYTGDIFSDIEVGSAGNKLNARYDASGESTVKFTDIYGIHADTGTYSAAGGYSHRTSVAHAESYDKIRAIFSDFPIKNKIRLEGWAIVEGGIEKYMWSVDGGKTWSDVFAESELTSGAANVPLEQKADWYDGVNTVETNDPLGNNCVFDVTIDLSAYVGEALDLILVAKPAGSDALCPVGRVDNVAVYGDPSKPAGELGAGMGSFYVRHREISVGGTLISQPTVNAPDGDILNRKNKWNIPPSNFNSLAYTIYEPYNVDYMNARKYTKASNAIAAGGTVTIDGYILCYSGVKEYRYTLDEGNSWTVIDQDVPDHTSNSLVNAYSDKTFTLAHDKANSNFCAYDNYGGTPITVTLPSGVTGNKNLRVVAESNAGYIYPILNLPLSIT